MSAAAGQAVPKPPATLRPVAIWLGICCAMVFAMVVLGGVTRLTESGLSIVDWRPIAGLLPPLTEIEWQAAFGDYRDSPEFRKVNFWMTLGDYKAIYWMEYAHRLWGRAIGVIFGLPFLYFLWRGRLRARLRGGLWMLFGLGALQGVLGWYMVKSGLVDKPEVSQYRLAAHLGLAMVIYGVMLWIALGLGSASNAGPAENAAPLQRHAAPLQRHAAVIMVWTFATAMTGAFVAGLDAGLVYNTFPLMDGRLIPAGALAMEPWPLNLFENAATVQFIHRVAAILLVVVIVALWARALRAGLRGRAARATHLLAAMSLVQAGLGIATLLSHVEIPLAATHQAGAMVLFTFSVWTLRRISVSA